MNSETIDKLVETTKLQNEILEKIFQQPALIGTLLGFGKRHFVVGEDGKLKKNKPVLTARFSTNNTVVEIPKPTHIALEIGSHYQMVQIQGSYAVLDTLFDYQPQGKIYNITEIASTGEIFIKSEGGDMTVLPGNFAPKKGDRVMLDSSESIIIANLGQEKQNVFCEDTKVTWDDIGGLDDIKDIIREAIELPLQYPDIYRAYGSTPPRGILLYGSPGNGKTMIGKATASSVAEISKKENSTTGFIYVKAPEILNKFVGESEAHIRRIFETARTHYKNHGYPAVIFIDEAEAILNARGSGRSTDIERTIVPQFLAEMDGLVDAGAIVMLATNRPDLIDQAILRDGRIDHKISIPRPDRNTAQLIFSVHAKKAPFAVSATECSQAGIEELFSEEKELYRIEFAKKGKHTIFLKNIVNGAMIANIIQHGRTLAIKRDIAGKKTKPSGITSADISSAVGYIYEQQKNLNHNEEINEFVRGIHDEVLQVEKIQ